MANFNAIRYNNSYTDVGKLNLITTTTASSDSTISFTSGIDSTYKEYIFIYNNLHPETNNVTLGFQGNVSGESGFNETITSSHFIAQHAEGDGEATLENRAAGLQTQGTAFQILTVGVGNDNDQSVSGILHLFDPSNTTHIKHFIVRSNVAQASDYSVESYVAGYFNVTGAIDEIQFKFSSGNIDSGVIQLFGVG